MDSETAAPQFPSWAQPPAYDANTQADIFDLRQGGPSFQSQHGGPSLGSSMEFYPDALDGTAPPSAFPGLFFTNFDEQNPLPGCGSADLMQTHEEDEQTPTHFGHN